MHLFDLYIGGYLGTKNIIPEHEKAHYLVNSIMEESITSSQMEGANTTRKKAKEMLQKELKPINKSEQMIYNNFQTIKYIVQHKNEDLTPENLLYIHSLISKKTLDNKNEEENFRLNNDIFVVNSTNGETVHIPPDFKEIPQLITDLCIFFNEENERVFTINEIKNKFVISDFTARTDLNELVNLGFLESINVNKIKKNYLKSSRFNDLLNQFNIQ